MEPIHLPIPVRTIIFEQGVFCIISASSSEDFGLSFVSKVFSYTVNLKKKKIISYIY